MQTLALSMINTHQTSNEGYQTKRHRGRHKKGCVMLKGCDYATFSLAKRHNIYDIATSSE